MIRQAGWFVVQLSTLAVVGSTCLAYAGPWYWRLDLFAQFRVQYLAALVVLLPLLLLGRWWKLLAAAVVALGVNVNEVLPHLQLPATATLAEAGEQRVRCLTFNLLQKNAENAAIVGFIRQSGADTVVLQEVTPAHAEALADLRDVYPHQHLRGRRDSKGAAVLSRHPVRRIGFEPLPGQEQIGAVVAEVEAPVPFTVFGVHSHKPTSAAGAAAQHVYFAWLTQRCAEVQAAGRPVVLMGDFNSTPWALAFRRMMKGAPFIDTSRGELVRATWSVNLPYRLLIDHAFISADWRLVRREVGPELGSDHRALIVDLALSR